MSRRRVVRNKMAVPIKITVTNTDGSVRSVLACTLDASSMGARLTGIYDSLRIGQIVVLHYRHLRCQFLVRWVGERGTSNATQVGLECLEPAKCIWGVQFSDRVVPATIDSVEAPGRYSNAS